MTGMFGLGLASSFFFAFTFVLNRQMDLEGGSWLWSASLRFIFLVPMLAALLAPRRGIAAVLRDIAARPAAWFGWSTVGFGIFYASLCYGSTFAPAWLSAALWQTTIIAGILLSPLFFDHSAATGRGDPEKAGKARTRMKIPRRSLALSSLILVGVVLMQAQEAGAVSPWAVAGSSLFIGIAAFAFPLGNRKMMEVSAGRFSPLQRSFGMTLCSLPFFLVLALAGLVTAGPPAGTQLMQAFIVAVFSGLIATLLFFKATDTAHGDAHHLAVVESTQAGELVFALAGGVFVFGDRAPGALGMAGIVLVIAGMILNSLSLVSSNRAARGIPDSP